jgi:hypothetical protein
MYDKDSEFVTIGMVAGELTAQALKAYLGSVGIPAVLQIESLGKLYTMAIPGLGDTGIMVQRKDVFNALRFLEDTPEFSPDIDIDEIDDEDELDDKDESEDDYIEDVPVVIHAAAEPFTMVTYENEVTDLREVLSCPTCKYDREGNCKKGLPWCHAPEPPIIVEKYCHTFKSKDAW